MDAYFTSLQTLPLSKTGRFKNTGKLTAVPDVKATKLIDVFYTASGALDKATKIEYYEKLASKEMEFKEVAALCIDIKNVAIALEWVGYAFGVEVPLATKMRNSFH